MGKILFTGPFEVLLKCERSCNTVISTRKHVEKLLVAKVCGGS